MELRQLEYFVAVAEEKQFTRAAQRIPIAQSSLSKAIRQLEAELGTPLLFRTTRKVALTDAGALLLRNAKRVLEAADDARHGVDELEPRIRGPLSIGGINTSGMVDQSALLAAFHAQHPDVVIRYTRDTSTRLLEDVAAARLDVAFVGLPASLPPGAHAIELRTDPVMLVCSTRHRLARRPEVDVEEIADEDFVGSPPGTITHSLIDRCFAKAGIARRVPYQVNDIHAILEFVAAGLGVTLLSSPLLHGQPGLCAVPLSGETVTWTLAMAVQSPEVASSASRAFVALVRESAVAP